MAACCAVVYPHMNALGGDGFWIVKPEGCAPVGIDACGAAARGGAWPVKPLAADWKERLRRKPDAWPRSGGAVVRRRSTGAERTAAFAVAWWGARGRNVPASRYRCPDKEEAACRLLSNPRVNTDHFLESHKERMVERCRRERVVLAVQDTAMLHCNGAASGLASLGGGSKGIAAHTCDRKTPARGLRDRHARRRGRERERPLATSTRRRRLRAPAPTRGSSPSATGKETELLSRAVATVAGLAVRARRQGRVLCEDGSEKGLWDGGTAGADRTISEPRRLRRQEGAQETRGDARPARVRLTPPGDRRRASLHARRVGRRRSRPAVARHRGRSRKGQRGPRAVRAALDGAGAQVRQGRRRPAVRRRRRPSKVSRLRHRRRMPDLRRPTHGAG